MQTRIADEFEAWAERQIENSVSTTARFIVNDDDEIKFRIREGFGDPTEDIHLIRGKDVDTLRFIKDGETVAQFHAHRRKFSFTDKTLIVRHKDGSEICRCGTTSTAHKGPFPNL